MFEKGYIPWNKGKKTSIKIKKKLSKIAKQNGFGLWMKGKHLSKETKKKLSEIAKKNGFGKNNKGKKLSEKHRRKLSKALIGEKSYLWKGGVSKQKGYYSFASQRRKLGLKGNGGSHTLGQWETLKAQYNWTCPACKRNEPKIKLSEDHIIPISKGGSDNIENIQPLCFSCNSKKQTKIIIYGN